MYVTSLAEQHSQVVERGGDGGVVLAERLLADRERVVQQVSSLFVFVLVSVTRNKIENFTLISPLIFCRIVQNGLYFERFDKHIDIYFILLSALEFCFPLARYSLEIS